MEPRKPVTLKDAVQQMKASKPTQEEAASLDDEVYAAEGDAAPPASPDIPDWVLLPPGFKFPQGKAISFLKFRAHWTDTPNKGDRVVVMWNLNSADEKFAATRTRGDSMRLVAELSKQMIRVLDGHKADWTGAQSPGNLDRFWDDIGARCRQLVQNHYLKTHALTQEERADFFDNCIVVRTAG